VQEYVHIVARILITTFGSYGDLFPYLAIGSELVRLGHEVTLGTSPRYREKVEAEGLRFAPIRPDVDLSDREFLKYVFDMRRGTERIIRAMAERTEEMYEDTVGPASDADLIMTHPLTFAATMIAKKRGMPWVSTVLAPSSFLSAYDPPVLAPAPWLRKLSFLGPGFYRLLFAAGERQVLQWLQPATEFGKRKLGLSEAETGNLMFSGGMSPQLTLALFSPVFAPPQPDWPASAIATGFPFFEPRGQSPRLDPELEAFLDAGEPPVVFTLGSSAVGAAGSFYEDSFRAVARLGARTVFLTGSHPQGLPEKLPPHMLEWNYAPHSLLFPRASVVVHQGGAGTTAQALRSGRPMLVVPFAHDQFDNAERCRKLGVGRWIGRGAYNAARAEEALRALLRDPGLDQRCAQVAALIRSEDGTRKAAESAARITIC
jgi:UDP:flavonoid glycosyltransferase YjiC (YdhE family)